MRISVGQAMRSSGQASRWVDASFVIPANRIDGGMMALSTLVVQRRSSGLALSNTSVGTPTKRVSIEGLTSSINQ